MPKSKRNKQISLTKTHKKPLELKKHLLEEIRSSVDRYANIFLFSVHNMRNTKLKEVREQWKHSRFFFGKNKVMAMALGRNEEEEYRTNLHKISLHLRGQCGLLFTNRPVNEVLKWFESYGEADFARSGNPAVCDVELPEGPADVFHYSLEPYLRELGLPTTLKKGVVHLVKNYQVCKEGEILTPEKAKLLKLLGHQMAEFRIAIECYWSNNGSFTSLKTNTNGCENQKMEVEDHDEENENESVDDVNVKPEVNGEGRISISPINVELEAINVSVENKKDEVVDDSEEENEQEAMQVDKDAKPDDNNKEGEEVHFEDLKINESNVDKDPAPGSNSKEGEDVDVVSAPEINNSIVTDDNEGKSSLVDVSEVIHDSKEKKDDINASDEKEVNIADEKKIHVVDIFDEKETDVVNVSDSGNEVIEVENDDVDDASSSGDSVYEEDAESNEDIDNPTNTVEDGKCAVEVELDETKAAGENDNDVKLEGNTICSTPQDALPVKKRVLINADGETEIQNTSISEMQSHKRKSVQRPTQKGNKDVERAKVQAKKVESSPDEQSPVFRSLRNRTVKIKKKKN